MMLPLPLVSALAVCAGLGALVGHSRAWRWGLGTLLVAAAVAVVAGLLPGPTGVVHRPVAFAALAAASFAVGFAVRAALELAGTVRGRWVVWLPLAGAGATGALHIAPALVELSSAPSIALATATVGTEEQTRDLLLPLVQPMAAWVPWLWVGTALAGALLAYRSRRLTRWLLPLLWTAAAAAVAFGSAAQPPSKAFAESLARAALHPGEKVLSLLPLPSGPFALEPNFFAVLVLLAASGVAAWAFSEGTEADEPSGEPAGRGMVASLLGFALLASVQLEVGMPLPAMHGMAGLLLVAALCFAGALLGPAPSVRFSARTLLTLLLLLPWLLWGSLGALP